MIELDQTEFYSKELGTTGNCLNACVASILEIPISDIPCMKDCDSSFDQIKLLDEFLKPLGLTTDIESEKSRLPDYRIACGLANRGVYHSVVYYDDYLVHDPHPSREGILKVSYFLHIVKDEPIPCLVENNLK